MPLSLARREGEREKTDTLRRGGRTRARACRKREHGRPRVLPSRCTWVALISPGGSGRGGGDGDGGGGGGAATNLRAFRHRRAGVPRKGMHKRGGRLPHPLRGRREVRRGTGGSQVEKTVADLSINDQGGFRILFHGCTLLGIIIA